MNLKPADTRPVTLKATDEQVDAWEGAAVEAGMSRQAWCKAVLDAACGLSKLPRHIARVTRR